MVRKTKHDYSREGQVWGTPAGHYAVTVPRIFGYLTINPFASRLLYHYWEYITATGRPCSQSQSEIAHITHMSTASLTRAKYDLDEMDLIIFLRHGDREENTSDIVIVNAEKLWADTIEVFGSEKMLPKMPKEFTALLDVGKDERKQHSAKDISHLFDDEGVARKADVDITDLFEDAPEYASAKLNKAVETQTKGRNFKLKPPPGPENWVKKDASKTKIPWPFFVTMYRMCYFVDANDARQTAMMPKRDKGQVSMALGIMLKAGANLDRLHEFELWWAEQRLSKDRDSGRYRGPTPTEVRRYWGRAMADRDKQQVGSLGAVQRMEDRATEELLNQIQQAYMEGQK
jgi:hypothetical protein